MDQDLLADRILGVEEAVSELGVILEQGVLPSGAVAAAVLAVGQDGAPPEMAEEQPAALPMYMLSPTSWLTSLMYVVSAQPAQAAENWK